MTTHDAAALRAARQKRVAERSAPAQGSQPDAQSQNAPKPPVAAAAPAAAPPTVTPPAAPATGEIMAKVLDPSTVGKNASIDMLLYNEKSNDPHWVILADGKPLAEVRLSDQDEPQKVAKIFSSTQYGTGLKEAFSEVDATDLLKGIKARPYVAATQTADTFKALEAQAKTASAEQLRLARANMRDEMLSMLSFVVEAQAKNYIVENPIKDELFNRMVKAGVDENAAVAVIEASFQTRAPEHFEHMFKRAVAYMDMAPEAFQELRAEVTKSPARHVAPVDGAASAAPTPRQASNVPLTTASVPTGSGSSTTDDKAALKEKMSFRSRMVHRAMPTK